MRRLHVGIVSSLTCLSVVLGLLLITRQAKLRYDDFQKLHRLQDYAGQVDGVSESLQALEESAQALEYDVNQLKQLAQENLEKSAARMKQVSTT